VDVVLSVAVDAQVAGSRQASIVAATGLAALLIVGALELKITHVVQGDDV
jgi:hypothetical protein